MPGTSAREAALEPLVACRGVVGLAGLVILAAEDHEVVIALRLDAANSDTDRPCPRTAHRARALGDAAGHDVARVERELGLEQRRAGEAAVADERVVRRQHDVARTILCGRWP